MRTLRARRKKPTTRAEARHLILSVANIHRRRLGHSFRPYRMRNLHAAVAVVRHHGTVGNDTLVLAGFNPARPKATAS